MNADNTEPIRGQGVSAFFDSEGKLTVKAHWVEERTYRAFCGNCRYLIAFKDRKETTCPKCGTVNDLT